jgi:hypothetical protein
MIELGVSVDVEEEQLYYSPSFNLRLHTHSIPTVPLKVTSHILASHVMVLKVPREEASSLSVQNPISNGTYHFFGFWGSISLLYSE